MKLFGREPALWIGAVATVLSLLAGFGLDWLTPAQAALITTAINAILGLYTAVRVRPIGPAAFTYAVGALASLAAGSGLNVSQETVGAGNAVVLAVLVLLTRGQVSPAEEVRASLRQPTR